MMVNGYLLKNYPYQVHHQLVMDNDGSSMIDGKWLFRDK